MDNIFTKWKKEEGATSKSVETLFRVMADGTMKVASIEDFKGEKGDCGDCGDKGEDGDDGKGIESAKVSDNGYLYLTYTDGTNEKVGYVKGDKGDKGDTVIVEKEVIIKETSDGKDGRGIEDGLINEDGELVFKFTDGTEKNFGRVVGKDGEYTVINNTGGGVLGITIKEDGVAVGHNLSSINFTGTGVDSVAKDGAGNVTVTISGGGGGGSGDVVGPASATDNAIARFDTTTGKLIQNSAATIADTTGAIVAGPYRTGTLSYSDTDILATFQSSVNSYNQVVIQNTNSGALANTNLIMANNLSTASTNYVQYGITGSNYTPVGVIGANEAFLSTVGVELSVGTATANGLKLGTNGVEALTISSAQAIALPRLTTNGVLVTSGGAGAVSVSTNLLISTIGFTIGGNGSAITTGKVTGFFTIPYAGTITGWSIVADTGTATVQTWKIATGTAKPTAANSISTAGVQLTTGTAIRSTTVTDFTTTTVTANDIFAFNIPAISGATELTFNLQITRT